MKIRKQFFIVFMLMTILLMTQQVIAHPPQIINVQYSLSQQKLTVVITHVTSDPTTHYIEKIEVYKNNVTIIENDYTSQPSNTFTLSFTFPAVVGDWIKVEAECSLSGKTQEEIIVTDDSSNNPPTTPVLNGLTNGKTGVQYTYKFSSTDPDGDDVSYCVDWGDNTDEICIGPFTSGEEVTDTHTWSEDGTYVVKVKARDTNNIESNWATLTVTMPYSYDKPISPFLQMLFQRFPNAFPILRHLMGY